MKLLIHDLNEREWEKIADKYRGWEIISDNGRIKPCVGCFGCWIKDPGKCVIRDGYERSGILLHKAEEITVMSRYTYGGFSSFIKNVFDRSISVVLPYFEKYDGEMHHKARYHGNIPIRFIFRGTGLTAEDKEKAGSFVRAVCRNLRAEIADISFEECDAPVVEKMTAVRNDKSNKVILLNCSMRGNRANSKKFLDILSRNISSETESVGISEYNDRMDELTDILAAAPKIVLGTPLYVDGIPSQLLRVMEKLEKYEHSSDKTVYAVTNMGFYESAQIKNLLSMVRSWCDKCGFRYGGGLAIGAGEMMGSGNLSEIPNGPAKNMLSGLEKIGRAVDASEVIEDIYADAYRFPRAFYIAAANLSWPADAKKNGLKKKDLLRQY
ncbi:MAG: flavodoxin family protein [Oscillospiraceae bacterium]|nr:flavodoxin family protein [Oscillospiraceae bacterium]